MGYNTNFTGQVAVAPALNPEQVAELKAFAEERHEDMFDHSYWCKWEASEDGKSIAWNYEEKFYRAELWMEHLVRNFLQPHGHVVNGVIDAVGEDEGDVWRIEVRDNTVYTVHLLKYPLHEDIDPSYPGDWSGEVWARFDAATRRNWVFAIRDGQVYEIGPAAGHGFTPIPEQA